MHNRTILDVRHNSPDPEQCGAKRKLESVVQNDIRQEFRSHCQVSVVVNQSHCPEFVHEVRDARTRCAHHFREGLMTQERDSGIRCDVVLAQSRKFQENTSQPFFAVVEELIAKILFEIDITDE